MLRDPMSIELFALAELNHLRLEAMDIFEQSLTSGNEMLFIEFVEEQITHEPPRLQLLRDLSDDLQQRLLSLREYYADVRNRIVRAIHEGYEVDISSLAPAGPIGEHRPLNTHQVLEYVETRNPDLNRKDAELLSKMVEASARMADQLINDIRMATRLQDMVEDWLEGMNATIARDYWHVQMHGSFDQRLH